MFRNLSYRAFTLFIILMSLSLVLFANVALAKASKEQYQIGEEWSRIPVSGRLTSTDSLNRVIKASARIDLKGTSGTSFYLGKVLGRHLMLTNFHVLSNNSQCKYGSVYFEYLNKRFKCGTVVAKFKDLESTFFTLIVDRKNEYLLENLALQLDFNNEYQPGHKLVTAGYGQHLNGGSKLTYDHSQTCVVASSTFQSQKVSLKGFGAYSFAHACETSHGDSGSALVSEITGKVVGINWATNTQKPIELFDSLNLFRWIDSGDVRIWSKLSYGVPAFNIVNVIRSTNNVLLNEYISTQML